MHLLAALVLLLAPLARAKVSLETTEKGATFDVSEGQDVFVHRGDNPPFGLAASHDNVEARLQALEDSSDPALEGLVARVDALEAYTTGHPNAESRLESVETAVSGLGEMSDRISELEEQAVNVSRRLVDLSQQDCGSSTDSEEHLGLRIASLANSVDHLFLRLENQLSRSDDAFSQIRDLASLRNRLNSLKTSVGILEEQIGNLASIKTESSSIANSLTTTLPELTSRDALEAKVESLLQEIEQIEQLTSIPYTECALGVLNFAGNGRIASCTFTKKYDNSVLKLTWRGNLRVICASCTQRWYLTVDNRECKAAIDTALYENSVTDNFHRISSLTGFCPELSDSTVLKAGQHTIAITTGTVSGSGDPYTGWSSTSSFIIEEYPPNA
eukprot:m.74626 g.74626  ORF g.74626 m.74626 type:complete len:387 (-) comp8063_c0_seq2:103-1263(-)